MSSIIDALGAFGTFFLTILGFFVLISCLMWFFSSILDFKYKN